MGLAGAEFLACLVALMALGSVASPAVAVVESLEGSANVSSSAKAERRPLHLFDWLPAGAVVETGSGARATLTFVGGERIEISGGARVRLTNRGAVPSACRVRPLTAVPPLPRLPPLIDVAAAARASAVRIRHGARILGLYPRGGVAALPGATTLTFAATGGVMHRLELEDETGRRVFEAETRAAAVPVPPGVLIPGARYYWRVRTVEVAGPSRRGEAEFSTLDAQAIRERAALHAALKETDSGSRALLAEVDRRLGLLGEARDGLRAALAAEPGNAGLRQALDRIERDLMDEDLP